MMLTKTLKDMKRALLALAVAGICFSAPRAQAELFTARGPDWQSVWHGMKGIATKFFSCEQFLESSVDAADAPNGTILEKVLAHALEDKDWFYQFIREQPGTWLLMPNGEWTRYVVYPAKRPSSPALAPFRLGSGLSVDLERTLEAKGFIEELRKDRDVYVAESPGVGLSGVRNIIEARYPTNKQEVPKEITVESLQQFMTVGWQSIMDDAPTKFPRLAKFEGKFIDVDHSWAGWVKMKLLPEMSDEIESVTFLTPGAQSTMEHLIPMLAFYRESVEAGSKSRLIPATLNPFTYWEAFEQRTTQFSTTAAFRSMVASLRDDQVRLDFAMARFNGIRRHKAYAELEASSPERQVNIVIAQKDSIVPPSLLADVVKAARARGQGRGKGTTTAVLIPGPHEVMEHNSTAIYQALGAVIRDTLGPGAFVFDGEKFNPIDDKEFDDLLRHSLMQEWKRNQLEILKGQKIR